MKYEKALNYPKPVLGSSEGRLIERKQMSTKTTFKRIALVAVAALGLGVLTSVAPASAVPQADTLTSSATTASALPGADAKITVTQSYLSTGTSDTVTATVQIVSMPTGNSVLPTFSTTLATGVTNAGSPVQSISGLVASSGSVAANTFVRSNFQLILNSQVKGVYVFKVSPQTGSNAAALTLTYTIEDTATGVTAAASRVYMQAGAGQTNRANGVLDNGGGYAKVGNSTTTNAALLIALGAHIATQDADTTNNVKTLSVAGGQSTAGTAVANFGVILGNGDTITASTISGGIQCDTVRTGCLTAEYQPSSANYFNVAGYPVTATVSGPGWISYDGIIRGKTYTDATLGPINYLQKSFKLLSDGTVGASTVTFTQGAVTLGSFTVNFLDKLASYTATTAATFGGSSYPVGTNTSAITVKALDTNGLPMNSGTVYAFSGTAATATIAASASVSALGVATFNLVGVAAGTSVITFGNASTIATSTILTTTTVEVTGSIAKVVTVTLDKAEYAPGEKMTLTIKATDANGKPVADGSRALIASPTTNVALGGTVSTTTTLLAGSATQTLYAPATFGAFTITVTEGADTSSTTKVKLTATATVVNAAEIAASAARAEAAVLAAAVAAKTDAAIAALKADLAAQIAASQAAATEAAAKAAADTAAAQKAATDAIAAAAKIAADATAAAQAAAVAAAEAAADAAAEAIDAGNNAYDSANAATDAADAATAAAQQAGEDAVAAAEAAGAAAVEAAQSAQDAAAEATDAATAATDAANAAAEAADAATAAAQDAADAVAALSVQVTEVVASLKKQITALTNLVIRIQKKVKA